MKITAITIENFKGISEPVRVELKPITLLFGANSAGKSTIIQALHYVREILERNNLDADRCLGADESFDLGGFQNLVHNHELERTIRLKVEMALSANDLPEFQTSLRHASNPNEKGQQRIDVNAWNIKELVDFNSAWVELEIAWSKSAEQPVLASYATGFDGIPLAKLSLDEEGKRVLISSINLQHPSLDLNGEDAVYNILKFPYENVVRESAEDSEEGQHIFLESYGLNITSCRPSWGKSLTINQECYREPEELFYWGFVDEFEGYLSQLLVGPGEVLLNTLRECRYIGPIRKTSLRDYTPIRSEDETRWSSGLAAWDLLHREPSILESVNSWISEKNRLNTGYSLELKHNNEQGLKKRLILHDLKRPGLTVQLHDIGVGISQMIPVVVGALNRSSSILMVEQPELHIHPALQVELGDLFISQIQNGTKIFIIETHSEHLILRLMRRMRQTADGELPEGLPKVTPDDVSILYVQPTDSGSVVRVLELDAEGQFLDPWPGGFFEEGFKERFA